MNGVIGGEYPPKARTVSEVWETGVCGSDATPGVAFDSLGAEIVALAMSSESTGLPAPRLTRLDRTGPALDPPSVGDEGKEEEEAEARGSLVVALVDAFEGVELGFVEDRSFLGVAGALLPSSVSLSMDGLNSAKSV